MSWSAYRPVAPNPGNPPRRSERSSTIPNAAAGSATRPRRTRRSSPGPRRPLTSTPRPWTPRWRSCGTRPGARSRAGAGRSWASGSPRTGSRRVTAWPTPERSSSSGRRTHARRSNPRILHRPRSRSATGPLLDSPRRACTHGASRPATTPNLTYAMVATTQTVERTSESPHLRVGERLRILAAHREILANLVRKELKVKYAASVLGAVWSLLNPLVYLAVFSFVAKVLGAGIPSYPVYLLSGLLAWNLFSASMGPGARAVLDNANLVKKVAFAREILPLAAVGVGLVDFALQSAVLLLYILVSGYGLHLPQLPLWPLAFVTLLVLTVALSLWFSAWNVRYRDVGHLLNIALLVWFWATPIVYAEFQVLQLAERGTWVGIPPLRVLP